MKLTGRTLQILGVAVFLFGIVVGILLYTGAKDDISAMNSSTKSYKTVYSNGYTEADYVTKRKLYLDDIKAIALWSGLGAIGGLIGLSSGSLLVLFSSRENENNNKKVA